VSDLGAYDAVVLGSAVYMGTWLEPARALVDTHAGELSRLPTWLFSSGPIGDPLKPSADDAVKVDDIVEKTAARGHVLLAGKLDKSKLRFGDRAVVTAFRSSDGDFRDWEEIEAWARSIAADLAGTQ
jgi:menaquinone-dependent protoporphyrinogen oxidase